MAEEQLDLFEYSPKAGQPVVDRVLWRADFLHDFSHPSEHGL